MDLDRLLKDLDRLLKDLDRLLGDLDLRRGDLDLDRLLGDELLELDLERDLLFSGDEDLFLSLGIKSGKFSSLTTPGPLLVNKTLDISSSFAFKLWRILSSSSCLFINSIFFFSTNCSGIPFGDSIAVSIKSQSSLMNIRAFLAFKNPVKFICMSFASGNLFSSN